MSKYNVGDKFVIEITKVHPTEVGRTQYYTTNNGLFLSEAFFDKTECYKMALTDAISVARVIDDDADEADWWSDGYNAGMNDAWEAARKIICNEIDGGLSTREMIKIFGSVSASAALKNNTVSEAIAKIREFDEEKAENAKIKVGDVVVERLKNAEITFVVCLVSFERIYGITGDGKWNVCQKGEARKTGKHFPEIVKVLEAMKNEHTDSD